jgi:hypothetical protein
MTTFMAFILACCLGGCVGAFTHPNRADDLAEKVALLFIIAIIGWLLFRIVRSGVLIASASGFVVRDLLRTHRYNWDDVTHFEEMVLPIGASGVPRRFLRVHLGTGRVKNFTVLNDSRRRNPDVMTELVERLGEMKRFADAQPSRRRTAER